jgi:hypothetical protein
MNMRKVDLPSHSAYKQHHKSSPWDVLDDGNGKAKSGYNIVHLDETLTYYHAKTHRTKFTWSVAVCYFSER